MGTLSALLALLAAVGSAVKWGYDVDQDQKQEVKTKEWEKQKKAVDEAKKRRELYRQQQANVASTMGSNVNRAAEAQLEYPEEPEPWDTTGSDIAGGLINVIGNTGSTLSGMSGTTTSSADKKPDANTIAAYKRYEYKLDPSTGRYNRVNTESMRY